MHPMAYMHGFGSAFGGAFLAFLVMRVIHRLVNLLVLVVLIGAVIYFWSRSRDRPFW